MPGSKLYYTIKLQLDNPPLYEHQLEPVLFHRWMTVEIYTVKEISYIFIYMKFIYIIISDFFLRRRAVIDMQARI